MLAAMCLVSAAFAQKKKTVAVYVTGNCSEEIKKVVSSRIVAQIVRSKAYAAVERTADFLAELQREQYYQYSGKVDDGQIIKLGKQFGAGLVCVADASEMVTPYWRNYVVSQQVYEYIFTTRLIDIETGLIISLTSMSIIRCESNDEGDCEKYVTHGRYYEDKRYDKRRIAQETVVTVTDILAAELLQNVTTTAGKQKLAVYVTRSSGTFEGKSASSRLMQNFTNSGIYAAIDRTSDFQKEIGYQYTGKVNDIQLTKLGRQFGVNLICVVDVLGTDYTDVRMIEAETGIIMATAQTKSWRMDAIDEITRELMMQLVECIEKDKQLPGNFAECCEELRNIDGICRDESGAAYWIDKSVCGVEVLAKWLYYESITWSEACTVCPAGWRLPSPDEVKCIIQKLYNVAGDHDWLTNNLYEETSMEGKKYKRTVLRVDAVRGSDVDKKWSWRLKDTRYKKNGKVDYVEDIKLKSCYIRCVRD
jgi:hypothetical protein